MQFYMPTKLYFEENCVLHHAQELAQFGQKALIVTGSHSAKVNGSLEDVIQALTQEGISYCIFHEIEENPSLETVTRAAAFGIQEKADFLIGIGGGSPMDASKAIAVLMKNPEIEPMGLFEQKNLPYLPVVAVPTTAGTGSEATPYAILTVRAFETKRGISHAVFPELSLVDAKYLAFAKPQLIKNTAVDALAHLVESYVSTKSNPVNRMCSQYGMQIWKDAKSYLTGEKEISPKAYQTLSLASTIAGIAISHTSTALPHGLSYYLTYEKGVAHGKAVGTFLAAYLAEAGEQDQKEVLSYLEFSSIAEFSSFLRRLIGEVCVTKEEREKDAQSVLSDQAKLANVPFAVTSEVLDRILDASLKLI